MNTIIFSCFLEQHSEMNESIIVNYTQYTQTGSKLVEKLNLIAWLS